MRELRTTSPGEADATSPAGAMTAGKRTLVEGLGAAQGAPGGAATVVVTASALRVRSSPDTASNANVLGKLHEGDQVPATGQAGGWLTTPFAGTQGYISAKYTRPASLADKFDDWISALFGGGHDHPAEAPDGPEVPGGAGGGPSKQDPQAPVEPAGPAGPAGPDAPVTPKPTPAPPGDAPTGAAALTDAALAAFVVGLRNPQADAAAHAVAGCEQASAELAAHLDKHEETGAGRDALVASIAVARTQVAALDGAGLDPVSLAHVRTGLYAALARTAPYYSQGRNIDVLETQTDTRTCNLTTLAMVLEGLGKSAADYTGSHDKVLAVARYTAYAPRVDAKVAGASKDFGKLTSLRLPDFLQLAAIAECLKGGTSDSDVLAAAQSAWGKIVNEFTIHIHLAQRFGVNGETKVLEDGLGGALGSIKKSARKEMQKVVDARNEAERTGDAGDQAAYAKLRGANATALDGDKIEDKIPLDTYRDTVLTHIGGELASGAGVFMLMAAHYARVQMVSEDHVIIDDPGQHHRSGQKVLWEEARAMGYFKKRIVFR